MSLRYIKTSAPSYVTGAAMTTPEQFTDNINFYSDGYNPYQIVLESDATPPVQVGLVSMENIQQQQQQLPYHHQKKVMMLVLKMMLMKKKKK